MGLIGDGKSRRERMPGWPIDGKPVRRLIGMIYWYGWGDDRDFDIREVRKKLGLPAKNEHDDWFMAERPNACASFQAQMTELQEAMAGRPFGSLLDEIEREQEEAWRRDREQMQRQNVDAYGTPLDDDSLPF
jgi:hypothetical protein